MESPASDPPPGSGSPVPPPGPRRGNADRRQQILDAAWECFARTGFHATSMQEIATAAEISVGLIYRYFESKEDIIVAIMLQERERWLAFLSAARRAGSPAEALHHLGSHCIQQILELDLKLIAGQTALENEAQAECIRHPQIGAPIVQAEWSIFQEMAEMIADGQRHGLVDAALDPMGFVLLWGSILGGVTNHLSIHHERIDRAALQRTYDYLYRKMLSVPTASPGSVPAAPPPPPPVPGSPGPGN